MRRYSRFASGGFVLGLALVAALTLSACSNTFHGVGRDMERAGRTIQDSF